MRRQLSVIAMLLTGLLVLAGCGGEDAGQVAEGRSYNDADVTFATEMIQHHAGALTMVDMTVHRDLAPQIEALAEDIRAAQGTEIETMVDWLQEWNQPIPETVRDHANAHGDGMAAEPDMPGMMSHDELEALEAAQGQEFESRWLQAMIVHHQAAIEMARTEQADGEHPDAVVLAERIEDDQEAEIARMEKLLGN